MEMLPVYLIAGVVCVIAFISGIADKKFLFIKNAKTAVLIVAVCGFVMCIAGLIGVFITKAPMHPLTIAGYVLGALALIIAVSQIFNRKLPFANTPKKALILVAAIVAAKVVIARFYTVL